MRNYIKVNEKAYDLMVCEYEKRKENPGADESKPEGSGNKILELLCTSRTDTIHVLEIGPGAGQTLLFFEQKGYRTIGVEISNKMAQLAKRNSPNSLIINQDINSLKFSKRQFNIIYMGAVIHLFPKKDAQKVIENAFEWLYDDGILYVNTTIASRSYSGYFRKKDYNVDCKRYRKYWREEEFESFLKNIGFRIIYRGYSSEKERDKSWVALYCKKDI